MMPPYETYLTDKGFLVQEENLKIALGVVRATVESFTAFEEGYLTLPGLLYD